MFFVNFDKLLRYQNSFENYVKPLLFPELNIDSKLINNLSVIIEESEKNKKIIEEKEEIIQEKQNVIEIQQNTISQMKQISNEQHLKVLQLQSKIEDDSISFSKYKEESNHKNLLLLKEVEEMKKEMEEKEKMISDLKRKNIEIILDLKRIEQIHQKELTIKNKKDFIERKRSKLKGVLAYVTTGMILFFSSIISSRSKIEERINEDFNLINKDISEVNIKEEKIDEKIEEFEDDEQGFYIPLHFI
eukprot:gnl/Spiro4/25527_TR12727_c0_g1_i1.p1 gnl/Spiro4/25527_TR12727_c0_g1~~gnl/Spiro4/25527_TR12727_c0_g1_i1.p1  ORF type:complete len:263 (-),score=19.58 gnl/Spiro4/25527_TR12727_c0_g1_i1:32-769(-)